MNPALQRIRQILPPAVWGGAREAWYGLQRSAEWPAAALHPWRRASLRRLAAFKDLHKGQRGFIIGNGPSLKRTDLSCLQGEFTFGMNRIYLAFPELGFHTTYYLSVNTLVIEQCAAEIQALQMPKFLSWRSRHALLSGRSTVVPGLPEDLIFLHTTYSGPRFARDARSRLWEGATVTYVALQLAFHMGFEQVILVGVDHNFTTTGKPNSTVVSQGEDRDHFHHAYFGKGFRWQLPDLQTSERAYRMAHAAYLQAGRRVLDATIGGRLDVFPKVEYERLF